MYKECGFVGMSGMAVGRMTRLRGLWRCGRRGWRMSAEEGGGQGGLFAEEVLLAPPRRKLSSSGCSAEAIARIERRQKRSNTSLGGEGLQPERQALGLEQRVVSYNILSSTLCQRSRFVKCSKEDLEASTRLHRVLAKLEREVDRGSVICLQEVSMAWSGPLSDFFDKNGYHFVLGLSGNFINGYIGVGIAYPVEAYTREEERVERLGSSPHLVQKGDVKSALLSATGASPVDSKSKKEKELTETAHSPSTMMRVYRVPGGKGNVSKGSFLDEWAFAKSRTNMFVFLRLTSKVTNQTICFSTYHMPCAFFAPKVMVIHAALAVQNAQHSAAGDPLILAGDFNMKKMDAAYQLVTTGSLSRDDAAFPSPRGSWTPELDQPMHSAYHAHTGNEPDFTNYAHCNRTGLFVDCLDYIFVSKAVQVTDVDPLPHRTEIKVPSFPTKDEPSDHIMIGATVQIAK